jgi:hypothetical protein
MTKNSKLMRLQRAGTEDERDSDDEEEEVGEGEF